MVCKNCTESLRVWTTGKRDALKFGVPMVWTEPSNHSDDCYFCLVNIIGINKKNRRWLKYPDSSSARRPISHSEQVPVPTSQQFDDEPTRSADISRESNENEFEYAGSSFRPQRFNQNELNDLVRDLGLSKKDAELLVSRFNEKNLIDNY